MRKDCTSNIRLNKGVKDKRIAVLESQSVYFVSSCFLLCYWMLLDVACKKHSKKVKLRKCKC